MFLTLARLAVLEVYLSTLDIFRTEVIGCRTHTCKSNRCYPFHHVCVASHLTSKAIEPQE